MRHLLLLPPVLSALLLGAHLLRAGWLGAGVAVAALPLLLVVRRAWPLRLLQLTLALGVFEWVRTLYLLVAARRLADLPYVRLTAILGAILALTLVSMSLLERWDRRRIEEGA